MTFDLATIALLAALALAYTLVCPARLRGWALYLASLIAVYALQPALPIRFSDFILPTAALTITALCWAATRPTTATHLAADIENNPDAPRYKVRTALIEAAPLLGVPLVLTVFRALGEPIRQQLPLVASRPPDALPVLIALIAAGGLVVIVQAAARRTPRPVLTGLLLALIGLFIVLKTDPLATETARLWRAATGQDQTLAALIDLNWLGFSYLAFRLIHTLRDRQMGILPALTLREYVTYVVFFPALVAGPIDRAERFVGDLRALPALPRLDADRLWRGTARILMGIFKKFVIADSLALGLALTPTLADQAVSTPYLWLLLYGYGLRLFFDFSGYTDIAIGLGILFGITLPENFNRPYLKTNITTFWQSWHMTLSAWVRTYVFSPFFRALSKRQPKPSPLLIAFSAQMATMLVIGLWHGVTVNFVIWGVWHALALFVHKVWSDRTRAWYRALMAYPIRRRVWAAVGWFVTVQWVMLGWVWFVLPTPDLALRTFARLLGWP